MRRLLEGGDDSPAGDVDGPTEHDVSAFLGRWRLTRRELLLLAAGAAAAGILDTPRDSASASAGLRQALLQPQEEVPPQAATGFSASVIRPKDLLSLRFEFVNLQLRTDLPLGQRLERIDAAAAAYVVVHFPPQNIAERAFVEAETPGIACPDPDTGDETGCLPKAIPVDARIAGASRLAFKVPSNVAFIRYTLVDADGMGLLNWERLEPRLVPAALPLPAISLSGLGAGQVLAQAAGSGPSALAIGGSTPAPFPDLINEPALNPNLTVKPTLRAPQATETSLEIPWSLYISPSERGGWAHASAPVTRSGRTELWHTRLGVAKTTPTPHADEQEVLQRIVRAIWAPGFDKSNKKSGTASPFVMSLTREDRYQIVRLSADFSENYTPQPMQVERLMLSSLGAWMETRGAWNVTAINKKIEKAMTPAGFQFKLAEWRHRATMGRDHYVRTVDLGYLFPFGHPAAKIKVTERKFHVVQTGLLTGFRAAFLRQREFIVVRKPEMTYPAHKSQPYQGRMMPFKRVRITTLVTPNLDRSQPPDQIPETETIAALLGEAFWPRVDGADFLFHIVALDADGQRVEFSAPQVFVSSAVSNDKVFMGLLRNYYYLQLSDDPTYIGKRRRRKMAGQKIAFAEGTKGSPGDTTLETISVVFGATLPSPSDAKLPVDQPRFYPTVDEAQVRLAAAEQVTGAPLGPQAASAAPVVIQPALTYLEHGFGKNNKGAVFAKMKEQVPLSFPADRSGGVVTPNMQIDGLSRLIGPVGGSADSLAGGTFNPATFFGEAKILGGISLAAIMDEIPKQDFTAAVGKDRVPRLITRTIYPGGDTSKLPDAVETKLVWKPRVKEDSAHVFQPVNQDTALSIQATFLAKLNGAQDSSYEIVGTLQNFKMNLVGLADPLHVITIHFSKLVFTAAKGQKLDVSVEIKDVTFHGVLELVNEFRPFLKVGSGFGGIDLLPPPDPGIRAGYTLAIPSIAVGVYSLQNISLSAALTIPFTGKPARVRFAFCERDNPFLLTVSGFGGGGFFAVELGLDGFESLEAALEFGGDISIDIGVASGGVYVMAGNYFKIEKTETGEDQCTFTGYLRLGGVVEVLGLVSVSAEFYMGLSYEGPPKDEIWGQASLTVEIEVAFFSETIEMSVERRFPASSHRVTFADLIPPRNPNNLGQGSEAWDAYAAAFAPVPA